MIYTVFQEDWQIFLFSIEIQIFQYIKILFKTKESMQTALLHCQVLKHYFVGIILLNKDNGCSWLNHKSLG